MSSRSRRDKDEDDDVEAGESLSGGASRSPSKPAAAKAGCWARLPLCGKLFVALALIGGALYAFKRAAYGSETATREERDRERAAEVANLKVLRVDIPEPSSDAVHARAQLHGARPHGRAHPFDPSRGRRVFIDAGARDGDSIVQFVESGHIAADWTIHAFDPAPQYAERWASLKTSGVYPHLSYHPLAVWTRNETLMFALKGEDSTVFGGTPVTARVGDLDGLTKVSGIDFDAFLSTHVTRDDWVVVKMNVEGAELPVLERLVATGHIELIDQLYVECHYHRLTGLFEHITEQTCQNLCHQIVPHGVAFFFWSRIHPKPDADTQERETGFAWLNRYAVSGDDCQVLTTTALVAVEGGVHSGHVSRHETLRHVEAHGAAHAAAQADAHLTVTEDHGHTAHSSSSAVEPGGDLHTDHLSIADVAAGAHPSRPSRSTHDAESEDPLSSHSPASSWPSEKHEEVDVGLAEHAHLAKVAPAPHTSVYDDGLAERAHFAPITPHVGDHLNAAAAEHAAEHGHDAHESREAHEARATAEAHAALAHTPDFQAPTDAASKAPFLSPDHAMVHASTAHTPAASDIPAPVHLSDDDDDSGHHSAAHGTDAHADAHAHADQPAHPHAPPTHPDEAHGDDHTGGHRMLPHSGVSISEADHASASAAHPTDTPHPLPAATHHDSAAGAAGLAHHTGTSPGDSSPAPLHHTDDDDDVPHTGAHDDAHPSTAAHAAAPAPHASGAAAGDHKPALTPEEVVAASEARADHLNAQLKELSAQLHHSHGTAHEPEHEHDGDHEADGHAGQGHGAGHGTLVPPGIDADEMEREREDDEDAESPDHEPDEY